MNQPVSILAETILDREIDIFISFAILNMILLNKTWPFPTITGK